MHGCCCCCSYANLFLSRSSREAVAKYDFFRVEVEAACTVVVEESVYVFAFLNTSAVVAEMKIGDAVESRDEEERVSLSLKA